MSYLLLPFMLMMTDDTALVVIAPSKLERKEPIGYSKDVQPIFQARCTACHSGKELKGQYDMGSYAGVMAGGKRKAAVIAGKPEESNLYLFSSHSKKPIMPPASEANDLTPADVAILKLWIEQGAKGPKTPEVKTRPVVTLALPAALVKPVRALALHPTTNLVAVGRGNQLLLVDPKTGGTVGELVDPTLKSSDGKPANAAHISLVESVAFSPDGATLATGSFREVILWNLEKKAGIGCIIGFADKVTAMAWSPKGDLLAIAGGAATEDGEIRLCDKAGKTILDLKSPHSDTVFGLAFSPDGTKIASAGADKFVRVFEVPSGKLIKSFEGHTQHVLDVGWSPDGKRLASAGADELIKIWDLEKGERVRDLKQHTKQVTRLTFVGKTPNFLSVSGDGSTRRWSIESGDPSRSFEGAKDYLYAVAANADGGLVVTGGEEGVVRIYDGKTAALLKIVTFDSKK